MISYQDQKKSHRLFFPFLSLQIQRRILARSIIDMVELKGNYYVFDCGTLAEQNKSYI